MFKSEPVTNGKLTLHDAAEQSSAGQHGEVIGVSRLLAVWLEAALVDAPIGYVLANPLEYAWSPAHVDFSPSQYWGLKFGCIVLFGLARLRFAAVARQRNLRA